MVKKTKTKVYDTSTATVAKKVTCGAYGDPAGYEMTMMLTPEGDSLKEEGYTLFFKKQLGE